MRIVIELKKDENAAGAAQPALQADPDAEFLRHHHAGHRQQPSESPDPTEMMDYFMSIAAEIVTRRTIFELKKAVARAHILEGLKIALDWLDAVIELIRESKTPPEAKEGLMEGNFADPASDGLDLARQILPTRAAVRNPGPGHSGDAPATPDRPGAGQDHRRVPGNLRN